MHQTRTEVTTKIPIPRKGTKYVARPLSNLNDSVPVVVAVRDMLKFARISKEVKEMIKEKLLKINGRIVKDLREPIKLFDIFEAGKHFILTLSPKGKFVFDENQTPKEHLCKVIGKKTLKENKTQINLHDGSNILSNDKIKIDDSLYLDFSGKISKHILFEKGKNCIIISGSYSGARGKILDIESNKTKIKLEDKIIELEKMRIVVI